MLKDSEDELEFGERFGKLLAIWFVGESDGWTVVINNSSVGDGGMLGIAGDVAQDFFFGAFDDGISKDNKAVGSEFKAPVDDVVKSGF